MLERVLLAGGGTIFLMLLASGCGSGVAQGVQGPAGPAGPPGLIYTGPYSAGKNYAATDVVTYGGSSYVAVQSSTNVAPTGAPDSALDWNVLAQSGAAGTMGATGPQGLPGPQGAVGPQGLPGPLGPQGAVGLTGAMGPAGVAGVAGPTGPTGAQGPQGIPGVTPSALTLSPWYGKTMATFGDSIFAGYGVVSGLAAAEGLTVKFNDSVPGRKVSHVLSNYPNGISNGYATPQGNTLAQDLGRVDVVLIEMTTNDFATALGSYGDAADAGGNASIAGSVRSTIETIRTANPGARVLWVTPYQMSGRFTVSSYTALRALMKAVCDDYGVALIDQNYNGIAWPIGGFPGNLDLYTVDGTHPSTTGATQIVVPYLVRQINLYGPVLPQ